MLLRGCDWIGRKPPNLPRASRDAAHQDQKLFFVRFDSPANQPRADTAEQVEARLLEAANTEDEDD